MRDKEIYELLINIDNGYEATENEKNMLKSIKMIRWYQIDHLPKSFNLLAGLTDLELIEANVDDISALNGMVSIKSLEVANDRNLIDISPLSSLTGLTNLDLSATGVSDISALSGLMEMTNLNLRKTRVSDVSVLAGFIRLTKLDLYDTLVSDISVFSKLTYLTSLALGVTRVSDISPLSGLIGLTNLDLSLTVVNDISALAGLIGLTNLSLRSTGVSDISALSNLIALTNLDLADTHVSDISALSDLTALTILDIKGTSVSDISVLSDLTGLTTLNLRGIGINDISTLCGLFGLTHLDLSFNNIKNISALSDLAELTHLDLSFTGISDISVLSGLKQLTNLDLSFNEDLSDINALSGLRLLTNLDLHGLTITVIPESLIDLGLDFITDEDSLKSGIHINGLNLTEQPIEIFYQPRQVILDYYKSLRKEATVPINECKVVFLGDGGAGKSLIIDRLMHDGEISPGFNGDATPGISISSKKYTIGADDIELHFWDFGGQAIMHSMHRMFLTNRTMYVVVTNARDNKANEQAWYWIRNIMSFANGAPIFLIVNQKDQNPSANVNENGLRKDYPALKEVRVVSALKDTKEEFVSAISDTLCRIVSEMKSVHTPFSKSWLALMNDLQEMPDDFIESKKFYEKCEKHDVRTEKEQLDQIIGWYQDLGVCFYSRRYPTSKRYLVLKPRWMLNALYILIFNGRDYAVNGIMKETDIYELICRKVSNKNVKKVYSDITYEEEQIQYILTVLLNYELIFRLDDERVFIPMLCDENEPSSLDAFDTGDALHISFEYTYLPENVLHKLMVRHGYDLNTKTVWRTGAIFNNSRCGWTALVQMKDKRLEVFAKTRYPETHPVNVYLDMIRESICKINEIFGITAEESITFRKDGKEDSFDPEVLKGNIENGQHTIYSKVFGTMISIEEILGVVNAQDRLFGQGNDSQVNALLIALAEVLLKLQDNRHFYSADENTCNTYVRDLLEPYGYICRDQTLHGVSGTGNSAGALDILIQVKDSGKDLSIYEAQKLKGFGKADQDYLDNHIKRLLDNYNARGIRNLLLISYVAWDKVKFNELANKYSNHVMESTSAPFRVVDSRLMDAFSDTFMRCVRVGYACGNTTMYVYHMIVRVAV